LLILFRGVTDRLIPLYAVGAFLAFTLSQAGMVKHWRRVGGAWHNVVVNGLGAFATGVTTVVVLSAKFVEGAWVTVLLIPVMLAVMTAVHRHYKRVAAETASEDPVDFRGMQDPIVITPIASWTKVSQKALRFCYTVSQEVRAVHVTLDEETESEFCKDWSQLAVAPARAAGFTAPELVVLESPYRYVMTPILDYVLKVERENPRRLIAVVLPEMVERHWTHYLLHNQRAEILKGWLLLKGNQRIIVINVPWYLRA
jgi:hypothetical protein